MCGVTEQEIRKAVLLFQGVKRRFDIRMNWPGFTYIDDYAHHPEEIKSLHNIGERIFQRQKDHRDFSAASFSRTRDHAAGFASNS